MSRRKIPDPAIGYSVRTTSRVCGLSTHMLNYLCRHRIVEPTAGTKRGRGNARLYSFEDVLVLRVIERLLGKGVSPLRLKDAVQGIQDRGRSQKELLLRKFVATDGVDIFFADGGVIEKLASGQFAFAFVLQLDTLRADTEDCIRRIESAA